MTGEIMPNEHVQELLEHLRLAIEAQIQDKVDLIQIDYIDHTMKTYNVIRSNRRKDG